VVDLNGDGGLSQQEIKFVLLAQLPIDEVRRLTSYTHTHTHTHTHTQTARARTHQSIPTRKTTQVILEEELNRNFKKWDKNKDGFIRQDELLDPNTGLIPNPKP